VAAFRAGRPWLSQHFHRQSYANTVLLVTSPEKKHAITANAYTVSLKKQIKIRRILREDSRDADKKRKNVDKFRGRLARSRLSLPGGERSLPSGFHPGWSCFCGIPYYIYSENDRPAAHSRAGGMEKVKGRKLKV